MKKRRKHTPSLFDRFCTKFGPSILKVCRFIDKHTHGFFENLACILTGGAYQPRPYKEPEEVQKEKPKYTGYFSSHPRQSISGAITNDLRSVMGDFRSVQGDIKKSVRRMERENPAVAQAMQEAKNSPQFQKQMQEVQNRMNEVQQRCNHMRHVCSHSTTVGTGNTSERERD